MKILTCLIVLLFILCNSNEITGPKHPLISYWIQKEQATDILIDGQLRFNIRVNCLKITDYSVYDFAEGYLRENCSDSTNCSECEGGHTTDGFINAKYTIKDDTLILSQNHEWDGYIAKMIYRINNDTLHLKLIRNYTQSSNYVQEYFAKDTVFVRLSKECIIGHKYL